MLDVTNDVVLSLRNVEVAFPLRKGFFAKPGLLRAVNDVSLDVRRGEFISIVGESGCGKSTLVKTLLGLQPATAGTISINGKDLGDYSRKELAHQVQPIFQDPYSSLNPRKSVAANIALPLILSEGLKPSQVRDRVLEIMEMVSLPTRLEHTYPSQMSGGQRQRVAIARALITRPKILICDEPTSALDVSVQAQILNLLRDLSRRLNLTSVFISHDLSVVRHLTQRVAVMYLGRVVELGESEHIFRTPRHPYTQLLIRSILPPDPEHRLPPVAWDGGGPDPTNPPSGCHFNTRCPYATDICRIERPPMVEAEGVRVACHAWSDPEAWRAANGEIPQLS
ncbi:ABC transporter ATP-binding protein [Actibacterium sp.]|uniref:ABC transporter ATP-binding protein n=1 Tax=Actibacterium sp. TaxID=1872125 RepID=UPI00356ABCA8